jgi:hypothetical protein
MMSRSRYTLHNVLLYVLVIFLIFLLIKKQNQLDVCIEPV